VRRLRFPPGLTVATAIACAALVGLGAWQWKRLGEKTDFLRRLRAQLDAAAVPLARAPEPLTRVRFSGRFVGGRSIPVHATLAAARPGRSLGGLGFWWLTPVQTDSGRIVLVNRGFVPAGRDNRPIAVETPAGSRTITGIVRAADPGNWFLPTDDPAKDEFFRREVSLLAEPLGLAVEPAGPLAPFIVDEEQTGDALTPPVGLDVRALIAGIPNNHLQYALTWWGLAVTLIGVYAAKLWSDALRDEADSTRPSV